MQGRVSRRSFLKYTTATGAAAAAAGTAVPAAAAPTGTGHDVPRSASRRRPSPSSKRR
jgi:anaerobic selenocysteine-containing dehydrogenase